jgi:hypothetical protein
MNKNISSILSILLTLFILLACTLVILSIFGVIKKDELTDSAGKIGLSLLVLAIASIAVNFIKTNNK